VVLALCAGTLGICVTFALRGILISRSGPAISSFVLSIDPTGLLQSRIIATQTGIVAGIGPALFETRRMQANPLRGIAVSDRVRQRWSRALVVFEITVTLALLVVTMSMIDQYQQAAGAELGFGPARLMVASVESPSGIPTTHLIEALGRMPGVAAVEASTAVPLAGRGPRQLVSADSTGVGSLQAERVSIGPGFFSTLGVPIRAGRAFTNQDSPVTRIAIVNEVLARELFGSQAPIGRQVWVAGAAYDVVGLAANYASAPIEYRISRPKIFLPLATAPQTLEQVRFLVRVNGDPIPLVQRVRRALLDASPGIVVTSAFTLTQMLTLQTKDMLLGTAPLLPLIVIGMLLTSSGIYGVLAFAIARRSREIAVRVAIGASRTDQLRLVTMQSLGLVCLGSIIGIGLTFGLSRVVRAIGGAGSYLDPAWPAFVWPVLIVFVIAALATWIPTRRALRINPAHLLRTN
jgi:hypothetical protein